MNCPKVVSATLNNLLLGRSVLWLLGRLVPFLFKMLLMSLGFGRYPPILLYVLGCNPKLNSIMEMRKHEYSF